MKQTFDDVMELAKKANGRSRRRTIGKTEVNEMMELIAAAGDHVHTIRVYSFDGFVPNSYKWPVSICYLEARRGEDGEFAVIATTTDAKRSHGNGALVTVNGRVA